MLGILGIALAIYLLSRTGKNGTSITEEDLPGVTGSSDSINTTILESENWPWMWTKRPAIFQETPLSPGSRGRWLEMGRLWMQYKDIQTQIYAEKRDAEQTAQERGGGPIDITAEIARLIARSTAIMKRIKQIAANQRAIEQRYKAALVQEYGAAQVADFYEDRKAEIVAGIWPSTDTQIVPVKKNGMPNRVNVLKPDANLVNTAVTMGAKRTYNTVDLERDAAREAMQPGKRFTDAGTVYYEYRKNRSDYPGSI